MRTRVSLALAAALAVGGFGTIGCQNNDPDHNV